MEQSWPPSSARLGTQIVVLMVRQHAAGGHRRLRAARRRPVEDRPPRRRRRPADRGGQERPARPHRGGQGARRRGARPRGAADHHRADQCRRSARRLRRRPQRRRSIGSPRASRARSLPAPDARARRAGRARGFEWEELAMFFFIGGADRSARADRRAGPQARQRWPPAARPARSAWWFSASLLLAGIAGVVALLLVGVFGVGGGRGRGRRRRPADHLGRRRWRLGRRRWRSAGAAASRRAAAATSAAAARRGTGATDEPLAALLQAPVVRRRRHRGARSAGRRDEAPASSACRERTAPQRRDPRLRRGRAALDVAVARRHARASVRSRCSASCACGTPSTTTAC